MKSSFSIIIPTLNEEHYLPQTLEALAAQQFAGDYEVIVVDGGSEDKTVEVARGFQGSIPNLRVVKAEKGTSHQRNVGAAKAKYPHLVFLDADTVPTLSFLQKLSVRFDEKGDYVALPFIVTPGYNLLDLLCVAVTYLYFSIIRLYKPLIAGTCLLTTKQIHQKIGGFNEKVRFAEDVDYGLRAIDAGARYRLLYSVKVTTSTRRIRKTGRLRLGFMWLSMYLRTVRHGPLIDHEGYDYEFGGFKKQ